MPPERSETRLAMITLPRSTDATKGQAGGKFAATLRESNAMVTALSENL